MSPKARLRLASGMRLDLSQRDVGVEVSLDVDDVADAEALDAALRYRAATRLAPVDERDSLDLIDVALP